MIPVGGGVSNHLKSTRLRPSGAGFFVLATILRTCGSRVKYFEWLDGLIFGRYVKEGIT